jgi:hypothetical protein
VLSSQYRLSRTRNDGFGKLISASPSHRHNKTSLML